MRVGFVGLGRMGQNMVRNLISQGFEVAAFNRSPAPLEEAVKNGAVAASSLADLVAKLPQPRVVWLMVAAGAPVDHVIEALLPALDEGDIVIEGGNSNYKDSVRRANELRERKISFLDCGTSGGLEGALTGACLTVGGDKTVFEKVQPIFEAIATGGGYAYLGPAGAGHYAKMVHNGIEYSMLQAYAEGFELLSEAPYDFDLEVVARTWRHGSVIRSWLLDLAEAAFAKDANLASITGEVGGGETGRWSVEEAWDIGVPFTMTTLALNLRFRSRQKETFAGKVVAAVRNEFGGHEVTKSID